MPPDLFPVVTHTARSNARTGIQTVTRGLCAGLRALAPTHPVAWHSRRRYLHALPPAWSANLGLPAAPGSLPFPWRRPLPWLLARGRASQFPLHRHPAHDLRGNWVLLPELTDGPTARATIAYAHRHHARTAAIFHDAICLRRPDLGDRDPVVHRGYMEALAEADVVLCVSRQSADDFRSFLGEWNVAVPPIRVVSLPAEVPGCPRVISLPEIIRAGVQILCVSTLEPRKNHRLLLDCFFALRDRLPDLDLRLQLAGAPSTAAPELSEWAESLTREHPSVAWLKSADAAELSRCYQACDFTVYPSALEGFGLPVLESLWFGRPCLCANTGPMADNAAGGGCVTANVLKRADLLEAMTHLVCDPALRHELSRQATTRPLATWRDYAAEVLAALAS